MLANPLSFNPLSALSNYQTVHDGPIDNPSVSGAINLANIKDLPETDDALRPSHATALKIMHILESYSVNAKGLSTVAEDVRTFLPMIVSYIESQEPVRMVLPAFPFKSPNCEDKALGILPDLGEELALHHLNGLCQNIGRVYEHGAEVHITSDGLVYNDLMGVSDETVWEYGETLRKMAVEQKLEHIRFIRLAELLDHHPCSTRDPESAKAFYLAHAPCLRRELTIRFGDPSFSPDAAIKSDMDVCLTYRGYIKFLTKDLAQKLAGKSKRARANEISQTARSMIVRGQMFAAAIRAQRGNYVRLSIHESAKGRKLSIPLIPQKLGIIGHTPWHSCIAVGVDGSYRATHADQVRDTHDLVYKDGRPYCYRQRSELFDWAEDGLQVQFEHLYPCGLIIRPVGTSSQPPSIRNIPMRKLRQLSCHMSPVICRRFSDTDNEDLFVDKAAELGKVAAWSQDIIVKVRDSKRQDKNNNNVKSNEAMPMHFDGMFRLEYKTDPQTGETVRVQNIPRYQFFTCRATAPEDSGFTLFASSRLFFRYLPAPWSTERLQKVTWGMDNDGFWDAKIYNLPLVIPHPVSGLPCLRWHQPWAADQTKFSTCDVTIHNDDASLIPQIDDLTYDYRVCKRFAWHVGDVLVNDNISMLHTRTAYTSDCDRELWRIHCD